MLSNGFVVVYLGAYFVGVLLLLFSMRYSSRVLLMAGVVLVFVLGIVLILLQDEDRDLMLVITVTWPPAMIPVLLWGFRRSPEDYERRMISNPRGKMRTIR